MGAPSRSVSAVSRAAPGGEAAARDGAQPLLGRPAVGRRPPSGPFPRSSPSGPPVRARCGTGCRVRFGVVVFAVGPARLWLFSF